MLGEAMDMAASLLGDDKAKGKTKAESPPEFERGAPLPGAGGVGATAPQLDNALDQAPIDLIHFGHLHADDGSRFVHQELDDRKGEAELEVDALGRAAMFRAAVQRETLLLHEFVGSTKTVLQQYEDSQGPIGEVLGAAMGLLSGGGAKDEPPSAMELDLHQADIAAAGGLGNQGAIRWIDLHTAGRDLHLCRADYRQFCADAEKFFVKKDGGGGGGGLGGLMPDLPGVTGAIKTVQGIVFKAFDVYLAQYLLLQKEYEDAIEEAAYGLTMQAIEEDWRPVYPIWFPEPPAPPPAGDAGGGGSGGVLGDAVDKVNETIEDVSDTVNEKLADARGFLGIEDDLPQCRGSDALAAVFAAFRGDEKVPGSPSAAGTFLRAFKAVIGVDSLPGFVEDLISEVTTANIALLERVYTAIMLGRAAAPVDAQAMVLAGREVLADKLIELCARFIPGLGMLGDEDSKLASVGGLGDIGGEQLGNVGSRYIDQLLGPHIGRIAELSSAELAPLLESARTAAGSDGATMELLLGRLPLCLGLQFRNTFFPLVDLVLDKLFGALAGPVAGMVSPVKGFLGGAKDKAKGVYDDAMGAYQDAMDVKKKVEDAQQKLADGVDLVDAAKDPGGFVDSLMGGDDGGAAGGGAGDGPPPPFPGSDRQPLGAGVAVTEQDYDEGQAQQAEMAITTA